MIADCHSYVQPNKKKNNSKTKSRPSWIQRLYEHTLGIVAIFWYNMLYEIPSYTIYCTHCKQRTCGTKDRCLEYDGKFFYHQECRNIAKYRA